MHVNHSFSALFVAGFSPEALQENTHFVGCIRDVHFQDETMGEFTPPVFAQAEVELGCLDQCGDQLEGIEMEDDGTENPCHNGGLCINHYTKTSCDCFGTGYEGKHCEKQGKSMYSTVHSLYALKTR